jgi:hypothetical protein
MRIRTVLCAAALLGSEEVYRKPAISSNSTTDSSR